MVLSLIFSFNRHLSLCLSFRVKQSFSSQNNHLSLCLSFNLSPPPPLSSQREPKAHYINQLPVIGTKNKNQPENQGARLEEISHSLMMFQMFC